jgi:hypothetical protein
VAADGWRWSWQADASARNALIAEAAGATVAFEFAGEGVDVRMRGGPGVTASIDDGPERDVSPAGDGWTWLPAGADLGGGDHTLVLRAVGPGATVDAFRVSGGLAFGADARVPILLAASAAVLGAALAVDLLRLLRRLPG